MHVEVRSAQGVSLAKILPASTIVTYSETAFWTSIVTGSLIGTPTNQEVGDEELQCLVCVLISLDLSCLRISLVPRLLVCTTLSCLYLSVLFVLITCNVQIVNNTYDFYDPTGQTTYSGISSSQIKTCLLSCAEFGEASSNSQSQSVYLSLAAAINLSLAAAINLSLAALPCLLFASNLCSPFTLLFTFSLCFTFLLRALLSSS